MEARAFWSKWDSVLWIKSGQLSLTKTSGDLREKAGENWGLEVLVERRAIVAVCEPRQE